VAQRSFSWTCIKDELLYFVNSGKNPWNRGGFLGSGKLAAKRKGNKGYSISKTDRKCPNPRMKHP
jgi:hypothetical protein